MPNTTNFGWATPADTDLVKDGAAAIRTLGSSIDTSFVDLKGGTTGQVLSKNSNTDLDFTYITVGAPPNFSLLNTGGTALTGATTITVSGISNINELMIIVDDASSANATSEMTIRLNSDTGSNYAYWGLYDSVPSTYLDSSFTQIRSPAATSFTVCKMANNAASVMSGGLTLRGCRSSGIKIANMVFAANKGGGTSPNRYVTQGYYSGTSTISSVSIISSTGNWDNGTVYVYGSAA